MPRKTCLYRRRRKRAETLSEGALSAVAAWLDRRRPALFREHGSQAVFSQDDIGLQIMLRGRHEILELDAVCGWMARSCPRFFKRCALDVGAHIGNHALFFARHFAHVHAFEPAELAHAMLAINCREWTTIARHRCALSDRCGEATLFASGLHPGRTSLDRRDPLDEMRTPDETTTLKTLDSMADDLGEVGLIKIDVEGHEIQVLRGAEGLIRQCGPVILFELGEDQIVAGAAPVTDYLRGLGYRDFYEAERRPSLGGRRRHRKWAQLASLPFRLLLGEDIAVMRLDDRLESRFHKLVIAPPPNFEAQAD